MIGSQTALILDQGCQTHSVLRATFTYRSWISYGPDLEKNLSRQDCISMVPKLICLLAQETS